MNIQTAVLPPHAEMVRAMLERDTAYEGVFFTAVKTTGIFCRPSCTARKPKPENVEFFAHADECMSAGYRACLRCKPLDAAAIAPDWVQRLLKAVETDPELRWSDAQLLAEGIEPLKLRRWFKQHFGMTFHAWLRTRRLGMALGGIKQGTSIDHAAFDSGYESLSGFRDAFQKSFHITPGRVAQSEPLLFTRLTTPLGPMIAMAERRGLVLLEFLDRPALTREVEELQQRYGYAVAPGHNAHLQQIEQQLMRVFRRQTQRPSACPCTCPAASLPGRSGRRCGKSLTATPALTAPSPPVWANLAPVARSVWPTGTIGCRLWCPAIG
jgi:AraC family transcriptional regulator of adaptative response/methylated-DNA-[protein]-cysteine methyltransferase